MTNTDKQKHLHFEPCSTAAYVNVTSQHHPTMIEGRHYTSYITQTIQAFHTDIQCQPTSTTTNNNNSNNHTTTTTNNKH